MAATRLETVTSARGYLDTASAEPLHPAARETLIAALERGYADPRRLHRAGREARLLLDNARAVVAECLGVHADEVGFAASGTDAVHRGLLGLVRARPGDGVVHSAVEHSSVLHAVDWHPSPAHASVAVDAAGRVDLDAMAAAARQPGVAAVALQAANQEVGTVQSVDELDLPDDVPLFVDAAASVGRLPLPTRWSALAASAHKWGGPSGVGVLVVRRSARWATPFPGDDGLDHLGGEPRSRRARGGSRPPGGAGRARRDRHPPTSAGRADPGLRGRAPRHRGRRRPGSTGSPTW